MVDKPASQKNENNMNNLRKKAIQEIESWDDFIFDEMLLDKHSKEAHKWIEVIPSGDLYPTEEVDNDIRHFLEYPDKEMANVYDICQYSDDDDEPCDCEICKLYRDFPDDRPAEEFIDDYGEDIYDYCCKTDFRDAILAMEHGKMKTGQGLREIIINNIIAIPYGYFDDETE